jgi:hypothetical protein
MEGDQLSIHVRYSTLLLGCTLTSNGHCSVKDHPKMKSGHKARLWCSQVIRTSLTKTSLTRFSLRSISERRSNSKHPNPPKTTHHPHDILCSMMTLKTTMSNLKHETKLTHASNAVSTHGTKQGTTLERYRYCRFLHALPLHHGRTLFHHHASIRHLMIRKPRGRNEINEYGRNKNWWNT